MSTTIRRRRAFDIERLAKATSHPGIDPRTWVSGGRIMQQEDAIRFEPKLGWIVDVVFHGTGLDQTRDVPSRVLSAGPQGDGYGEYLPPSRGCEVLLGLVDGDPAVDTVVLGQMSNEEDCAPPTTINGQAIEAELQTSDGVDGDVSPFDTEIYRSPHNRREQYDQDFVAQARTLRLTGDEAIQLIVESGAKIQIIGRGTSTVEITHEGTGAIVVDGPDIRLADGGQPIARVGDAIVGSLRALSSAPGSPIVPVPPALPTPTGGVSFAGQIVSGQNRAKA